MCFTNLPFILPSKTCFLIEFLAINILFAALFALKGTRIPPRILTKPRCPSQTFFLLRLHRSAAGQAPIYATLFHFAELLV